MALSLDMRSLERETPSMGIILHFTNLITVRLGRSIDGQGMIKGCKIIKLTTNDHPSREASIEWLDQTKCVKMYNTTK